MPYILTRRVRTSQPQQAVRAKSEWLDKGLYTATYGGFGDVLAPHTIALPEDTSLTPGRTGILLSQAVAGSQSTGISFPKRTLSARTELFIQECASRKTYGRWLSDNAVKDSFRGEYSDTELDWYVHGSGWNSSECIFSGWTPSTLVGGPRTILGKWGKDVNGGYGRVFVGGNEITRTGGTPLTGDSDRTQSSASNYTGAWQDVSGIGLFVAFSTCLSDEDTYRLLENPWQIFEDEEDYIWIPEAGGGVSNIAASGTVQASGTASPAVAVAMSGVGASLSSGTAADRVTVNIGAAGLATAAATAGISAQVLLAGAAAALASGNATLAATLNALAAGAAQSSGTATINSGVAGALAAVGTDVVSGSAPIRVTVSLGASGSDAVGGSAAIVGSPISPLSGAGVDVVSGSGAAVINVSLSAAGFVQAMAAGQLSMQVRLSSTGASVVSGVAGITSLGVTVDAPNGYGPKIIRPKTRRPANLGGIIF
jgi:hypothetical protein